MSIKTRLNALEEKLRPILERRYSNLSVRDLTDAELEFFLHQQYPDLNINDDSQLRAVIAQETVLASIPVAHTLVS